MQKSHFIYELFANDLIDAKRFWELKSQENPSDELPFFYYLFISIGISFMLVGLIFFIAANWQSIPKMGKLFGLQGLLLIAVIAGYWLAAKKIWFSLAMIAAAVLVGANLAAIGQLYQTGADAYTLFSLWTFLITPWALFLRLPHLFTLWFLLLALSTILFWQQYLHPFEILSDRHFDLVMIAVTHIILWLSLFRPHWTIFDTHLNRYLLLSGALVAMILPLGEQIFSHKGEASYLFILFLIQTYLMIRFYRDRQMIGQLGLVLLYILIVIEMVLAEALVKNIDSLFVFGLFTIILTILFAKLIRGFNKDFKGGTHA